MQSSRPKGLLLHIVLHLSDGFNQMSVVKNDQKNLFLSVKYASLNLVFFAKRGYTHSA